MNFEYAIVVQPLTEEDGGGYVARIPDLAGCMGDGETPEAAISDVQNAAKEWLATAKNRGMEIPTQGAAARNFASYVEGLETSLETAMNVVQSYESIEVELDQLRAAVRSIAEAVLDRDPWLKAPMATVPAPRLRLDFPKKVQH